MFIESKNFQEYYLIKTNQIIVETVFFWMKVYYIRSITNFLLLPIYFPWEVNLNYLKYHIL